MFEGKETLWVVHVGKNDRISLRARDEGFVCIGWTEIGDLSPYKTRDEMKSAMIKAFPDAKPGKIRSTYGQTFRFAHEMSIGDPIIYPIKPTSEIAIGKISSDYIYAKDDKDLYENDLCNIRKIEWLKILPRTSFSKAALHSFGSFSTVSSSNDYLEEVVTLLASKKVSDDSIDDSGPEEDESSINNLFEIATQETEDFLLKEWRSSGHEFEHVVAALFRALGYSTHITPASGDHGVDVIAHPDPLGIKAPFIKIQVKSSAVSVGEPDVNQLKGAVLDDEKGIFISLGKFTSAAESAARAKANITLIDAKRFVALFLDHYEMLEPDWRAKYPLRRTFVPYF